MIGSVIVAIFYQPFLNALVLIYWGLSEIMAKPDMGLAVIVFTIGIRILLLPLTIAATQSEDQRREIGIKYESLEKKFKSSEPLVFRQKKRELIQENKRTVRFEMLNLGIQLAIAIILWRVFGHGLAGADLHLIYSWVPEIDLPFNLVSFGGIDLTKPSITMNIISSMLLFLVETLALTFSPLPATLQDRMMQFLLPGIVFLYLYTMPAGKKFFVVTTLSVSVVFILFREMRNVLKLAKAKATGKT